MVPFLQFFTGICFSSTITKVNNRILCFFDQFNSFFNRFLLADAKKTLRALIDAGEDRPESPIYKAAIADRENWDAWHESFIDSDEMHINLDNLSIFVKPKN